MPRFYFHIHGRDGTIQDEEGSNLPDLKAARAEALSAIREMLAEGLKHGRGPEERELWIADRKGKVLVALPFRDAMPI